MNPDLTPRIISREVGIVDPGILGACDAPCARLTMVRARRWHHLALLLERSLGQGQVQTEVPLEARGGARY